MRKDTKYNSDLDRLFGPIGRIPAHNTQFWERQYGASGSIAVVQIAVPVHFAVAVCHDGEVDSSRRADLLASRRCGAGGYGVK